MASLSKIEGVGKVNARKFAKAGIRTTEALLKAGATAKGRKAIVKESGVTEKSVLRCVNCADLFRIKGVGGEYSDLLEAAGVDTVPELKQRNAANLLQKMEQVNKRRKLVRKLPTESQVGDWVKQAKKLGRVIKY